MPASTYLHDEEKGGGNTDLEAVGIGDIVVAMAGIVVVASIVFLIARFGAFMAIYRIPRAEFHCNWQLEFHLATVILSSLMAQE